MARTIDDLIAEDDIKAVQMRYCRASDRMDEELLRSCFHADATVDYGYFGGTLDQFVAIARGVMPTYLSTTHATTNQNVVITGDKAWAEHYTLTTHRMPADDTGPLRDFVAAVRYIDRLERRDGDWRIVRRELVLDWSRTDAVADITSQATIPTGQQDKSDLSYRLL